MYCPFCGKIETKVIDSRHQEDLNSIRRRRKCESCGRRFTTYETVELSMPMIVKNDGRRESYTRDKILGGIKKACQKRPVSMSQIENIINNTEKKILELSEKEVYSKDIGNLIMQQLRYLDPVAYVRFASVYRTFKDIDEFFQDLKLSETTTNQHQDITQ